MQAAHADMTLLKHRAILNANRREALVSYVLSQEAKGIKPAEALQDLLSGSGSRQGSGVVSLDRQIQAYQSYFSAKNIELIHATRPIMVGMRRAGNPDFIKRLVKGIMGDADASIGKDGQGIIDAWHKTLKVIREEYNTVGGNMAELENYGLPVNHNPVAIKKAGRSEWTKDVERLFNIRRKAPDPTLKKPLPALSDKDIIERSFISILSDGEELPFGSELGRRSGMTYGGAHELFRTLQPKNGEAWLEYVKKYGRHSNPVDAMKEYMDSMAKEIGLMKVLGPDYRTNIDALFAEAGRVGDQPLKLQLARATFDHIKARNPRSIDSVTNTFRGLRAYQTITKLPMAGITTLTDPAFAVTRALYNGMSPVKVLRRHIKNMLTGADYKTAAEKALFLDYANHMARSSARYGEAMGSSMLERGADISLRASGLNHMTNAGKMSFGLEMLSFMADNAAKDYGRIPKRMQALFERYGISETDWSALRRATSEVKGATMVDPMSEALSEDLRINLIGMIQEEVSHAIPEPGAKHRAMAAFGAPRNTIWHEIVSTGMQFKTFGVTVFMHNMGVLLDNAIPLPTKFAYAATLLSTTTIMGGLVLQLRDAAKGITPREMNREFMWDAMMQGGFMSVAGDIFFQDPDLFGGLPGFAAGPTVSDLNRLKKVLFGTYEEAMKEGGDWAKVLYPALEQEAERIAFPLKLWQTRVAAERLMLDHMRRLANPTDYYRKLNRQRQWLRERGQSYWSKPK
jgi:hypothetical protein